MNKPLYTKRHHESVATTINIRYQFEAALYPQSSAALGGIRLLASDFRNLFKVDNPAFDEAAFNKTLGFNGEK